MDFMGDTMASGRTFRTLNIVDDASRECLAIEVDHGLSGLRVTRVLNRLAGSRALPRRIVVDNGPEFTSTALDSTSFGPASPWTTPSSSPSTASFGTSG